MRLFKRHESKETMGLEVGMKECLSCYRNVRCTECDYEDENNIMKAQIARLKIENQSLRGAANSYKLHYNEAKNEAAKEFAEKLNDRIINFPSVYPIENATLAFLNGSSHRQLEILEIIDNLVKELVGEENRKS